MRLLILLFFVSMPSFALQLETVWTERAEKNLSLTCEGEETCVRYCQEKESCTVVEKVCKNCVGTSLAMTFAFNEMGRSLVASEKLDDYALFDLLEKNSFVSLTSRSVYNLVERFDSSSLKTKFRSLCEDGTRYPVVFFGKTASGEMGRVQAVWCESGFYEMLQLDQLPTDGELF